MALSTDVVSSSAQCPHMALSTDVVLREICSSLSTSDLANFRLVNVRFNDVVLPIYKKLRIVSFGNEKGKSVKDFLKFVVKYPGFQFHAVKLAAADLISPAFGTFLQHYGSLVTKLTINLIFQPIFVQQLLQKHMPFLESLYIIGIVSQEIYVDKNFEGTLRIQHLRVDHEWESERGRRGRKGSGISSLVGACGSLKSLSLNGCGYVTRAICEMAEEKKFGMLTTLELGGGMSSKIWPIVLKLANEGNFNSLKVLEGLVCPNYMLPFFQFVLQQMDLTTVWIEVDSEEPNGYKYDSTSEVYNRVAKLSSLKIIRIFPLFHLSALKGCMYLTRLVLNNMFSPHIYGAKVDSEAMLQRIFGGQCKPLVSVKRLKLGFYRQQLGPGYLENTTMILNWFPKIQELHLAGVNPNTLPAVWNCSKNLVKLMVKFAFPDYNFHLDEIFTGYNPNTCRLFKSGAAVEVVGNERGPNIADLKYLRSLQLLFGPVALLHGVDGSERNKMSDVAFRHGIHLCPSLKNFKFMNTRVPGYRMLVEITDWVKEYNLKELDNPDFQMTDWGQLINSSNEYRHNVTELFRALQNSNYFLE